MCLTPRFPRFFTINNVLSRMSHTKVEMQWCFLPLLTLAGLVYGIDETCLSAEENPYFMFGTRTAYEFANAKNPTAPMNKIHEIVGCQPIALWLLNRPGSHNPEADEIAKLQQLSNFKKNILDNYANGYFRDTNQKICASDLNILGAWEWNPRHNLTFAGDLTSAGYLTTQQHARAWRQRFPELLTDNRHDYLFKFVNEQRSSTTFQAFSEGLFRAQADIYDVPKENNEKLLRPYKFCPAWTRDVEENNNTFTDLHIFESKGEYKEMVSNISRRLGFKYDLDGVIIRSMYLMCSYNKAWSITQISQWCAAFTMEDLKRLEYAEDLKTYYKYGYGSELNQKIGCTLIKEMMDFFNKHVDNILPQQPRSLIHFTEAPMFMMLLTAMGARRDTVPLTSDNYHTSLMQSRKWTTSTMTPFNANLAAVLYKCTTNGNFQINEQYQVLFLENDLPMFLEGCRVGLCDWSYIKSRFQDVGDKCDTGFCNGAARSSGFITVSLVFVVVTFLGF